MNVIDYYHGWRYVLWCLGMHFLLSSFVGLLVYLLTSTILSRTTSFRNGVGIFSTYRFSLLVALCWSVSAHILEDYYLGKF